MIKRTLTAIAAMCGGRLLGEDTNMTGVSTDTRTVEKDNLYIPLTGGNFNGHDFVAQAFLKGASACLWEKKQGHYKGPGPAILVEDSLKALQNIAACYRNELDVYIIAITGSNGKTSTKDLLASIMAKKYRTKKNKGNLNNHIGTPLTLLDFDEDTQIGIVEMGMSALLEISLLTKIARPNMALLLNIGEAHLNDLGGSRDNIAKAKLEILEGLNENGVFIAHNENSRVLEQLKKHKGIALSYENSSGDYYPIDISATKDGMAFHLPGDEEEYKIPVMGEHQVYNAVAACACAKTLKVENSVIQAGLWETQFTKQRGQLIKVQNHTIIDDTYKSNPASLNAAIKTLFAVPWDGKKALIIGDMKDLGQEEVQHHIKIGKMLTPDQVSYVFTIGELSRYIAAEAEKRFPKGSVQHFLRDQKEELARAVLETMEKDPVMLLIKGARVLKLEEVLAMIQAGLL